MLLAVVSLWDLDSEAPRNSPRSIIACVKERPEREFCPFRQGQEIPNANPVKDEGLRNPEDLVDTSQLSILKRRHPSIEVTACP